MNVPRPLVDNLYFLIAEVSAQLVTLQDFFRSYSPEHVQRLSERSGYTRNLKIHIHDACIRDMVRGAEGRVNTTLLRAIESIATDLDKLSELGRDCVHKFSYLRDPSFLEPADYLKQLAKISEALDRIAPALFENNTKLAMKIGRVEAQLDKKYRQLLKHYIAGLDNKKSRGDLVSAMMMAHSLEKMGDVLLRISETIISISIGQTVDIERYQDLMASVEQLGVSDNVTVTPMAETRSGSAVSGITIAENSNYAAIYKEGQRRKLKEEHKGVQSWHEIFPGVAPKILSYQKQGESASLLIEHLAGHTIEKILMHESPQLLDEAMKALTLTLGKIWHATQDEKVIAANYMRQLSRRLDEVYGIHPEFRQSDSQIGGLDIAGFNNLLGQAIKFEQSLLPKFSVYIHGDFNLDNIIYNPNKTHISFIDLHRSRYMDYVQDVSVFMVSHYRLQGLDAPLRRRILKNVQNFYLFASGYAEKIGDETFELRLALGLARSFASSTRFIMDKSMARTMFFRARYLIENVLACEASQVKSFKVPIKELFLG